MTNQRSWAKLWIAAGRGQLATPSVEAPSARVPCLGFSSRRVRATGRATGLAPLYAKVVFLTAFLVVLLGAKRASAAEYYVAPTGSDSSAGSLAEPFASLQKGHDMAGPGDTVWLRGGTFKPTKQIKLSKSGLSDTKRIKFWAYQKELPVIDFSGYVSTNPTVDVPALLITGDWIHLRGIEVANVPVGQSGAHSISSVRSEEASHNTFELLNIHNGFGPGLFISKGTGGNLILNCDSHDNYDQDGSQGDGQNGDGFGVHYQQTGPSTSVRGCRAWLNSDDGFDLISQEVPVTIENCWAVRNGFTNGGASSPPSGNGNGFKAGSSEKGIRHLLQNNVAWKNKAAGFYANHSTGGNTWLNNTSYMNSVQYNLLASPAGQPAVTITLTGALAHKMRNNVGFPEKNTNMTGVDSMFNTWDLGIAETSADFSSTSDAGYTGPRQADGSLPAVDYLKLRAQSPLIDKGTDVGLPFAGAAPDLGAYEYGASGSTSGGGSGGAGTTGSAGSAGASGSPIHGGSGGGIGAAGGAMAAAGGSSDASAGADESGGNASGGAVAAGASSGGAALAGAPGGQTARGKGGCACALGSRPQRRPIAWLSLIGALAVLTARRRRARA